jgi:formylmethanofuran dehydrogenase subunit D
MRVRACIVKTAQFKASGEEGKFSEAYKREATLMLLHPDDMAAWGLKEGMNVSCKNPENRQTIILVVKPTRNASKGMVNIIASAWTNCLERGGDRFMEIDVEPSSASTIPIEQLFTSKGPGFP